LPHAAHRCVGIRHRAGGSSPGRGNIARHCRGDERGVHRSRPLPGAVRQSQRGAGIARPQIPRRRRSRFRLVRRGIRDGPGRHQGARVMDFERTRAAFLIPDNLVYLDGNSLGPLSRTVAARSAAVVADEWGNLLIRGWLQADWINLPLRVGDRIARIIGARPGTVTMGDTLSIKVFQALSSCLKQQPGRRIILSDSGNFPTDLYMAQGLIAHLGRDHQLKVVEPEDVADHLDDTVAALMLTHVDYRTGRLHDMAGLTRQAHAVGALTLWD